MCGRYQLDVKARRLGQHFRVPPPPDQDEYDIARFNIAPSQVAPVVRQHEAGGSLDALRWGFTPFWDKEGKKYQINARAETVAESKMFGRAFRTHRCIVPMTAFYEWDPTSKPKQPYMLRQGGGELFGVTGIWSRWKTPEGEPVDTYAVLTTDASPSVAAMGHHRMPVILEPEQYDLWLDREVQDVDRLQPLLRPWPVDLDVSPISTVINNARNEGPECVAPLTG